jgi:hypothetical protein
MKVGTRKEWKISEVVGANCNLLKKPKMRLPLHKVLPPNAILDKITIMNRRKSERELKKKYMR